MSDQKDALKFGARLQRLREERYTTLPFKYQYCKTQSSFSDEIANYEQSEKRGIRRQTLASWEKGASYPTINRLLILCKLLNCDPDYLLGYSQHINQDIDTISAVTGLKPKSIEILMENKFFVSFFNFLLVDADVKFLRLLDFIEKESRYYYLDKDLLGHYHQTLMRKMDAAFNRISLFSHSYDLLIEYERELKRELRNFYGPNGDFGILQYVSDDISNQIRLIKEENHIQDNSEDSYQLIVKILAEYTLQPLTHIKERERNWGRITQMFIDLVEEYFKSEIPKRKENIMHYVKNVQSSKNT